MLITARDPDAPRLRDGVLAHATSEDMLHWALGPPLSEPSRFGQLEVPQVREVDGRWLLVFTCHPEEQFRQDDPRTPVAARRQGGGEFSTWIVEADSPLGPFDIDTAQPFTAEPKLFAAPLVRDRAGEWVFIGFRNTEPEGELNFHIVDPIPLGASGL
jgi:beta-fructofuranosidase